MELPGLGEHCSESTCHQLGLSDLSILPHLNFDCFSLQLDFLPVKCDACEKIFCHSHMRYSAHSCPSAYKKDVQVPVCPLCNAPVPTRRGEQPDISVGAHIDNNCKSDTAMNRRKVFSNRCSAKGCKIKEMIRVDCSECLLNFCLKHRHPVDHQCGGKAAGLRRKAADAAQARQSGPGSRQNVSTSSSRVNSKTLADVQGSMSEDEALARALAASMQESSPRSIQVANMDQQGQEEADLALARALAESERMHQNSQQAQAAGGSRDRCALS